MKFTDTKTLLTLDQMYGYCNSKYEWFPMKQINRLKPINKTVRMGIWGVGFEDEKMYFQVNKDIFSQLVEKFNLTLPEIEK